LKLPILLMLLSLPAAALPSAAGVDTESGAAALHIADLAPIDALVQEQVRAGHIPGAVVVIGDRERVLYRKAFGQLMTGPGAKPMRTDTIFDLASLTKVVATTTAIMQLAETGSLRLDNPIANYWPEFAANGKGGITVRQALTHYSGLRPDLSLAKSWSGYQGALDMIVAEQPVKAPGQAYLYSDINFEILGELVRRVAGETLDAYCEHHIFAPLGMRDTGFKPGASERARIAPTLRWRGQEIWGTVHDPSAARMGGVAGHAGLFGSADDMAVFARMLLNGGSAKGARVLRPDSVALMTSPQVLPDQNRQHGLGWDLEVPLGKRGGVLVPTGFYGHTGYTGTSLWIDPVSGTYIVILSNRVYPNDTGDVQPLRNGIASLIDTALNNPGATALTQAAPPTVYSGLDMLAAERFAPLVGRRVGLITNQSGIDAKGRHAIDLLRQAPGVTLAAVFSPEHGLDGLLDRKIASGIDARTALPVHSLYGEVTRPTPTMLQGLDALVFDVQDAGVRFYTYISTMAYAMEAAAAAGIDFYVLDRPNPIGGERVEGPLLDDNLRSFTGYFPLPIRYGMTAGELAQLFNTENRIGAKLHVIKMRGYKRADWYDQTGLRWINPSPNLRSLTEVALYPGVALVEGANVSVGRGTATPFEVLGAPWIDARQLSDYLNARAIAGVKFKPATFTPSENRYGGRVCNGVAIALVDRGALDSPLLGVEIASALQRLYPGEFKLNGTLGMIGSRSVVDAIAQHQDPRAIASGWQNSLQQFRGMRERYLLYP